MSYWTKRRKVVAAVATGLANLHAHECESDMIQLVGINDYVQSSPSIDPNVHRVGGYDVEATSSTESACFSAHGELQDDDYVDSDELFFDNDSNCSENESLCVDLSSHLAEWALQFNISHSALSALLDILKQCCPDLPKDPRTLLKTASTSEVEPMVKLVAGGSYYHFGLAKQIEAQLHGQIGVDVLDNSLISVQINVDGVPLFKSTGAQFWPILGKLVTPFASQPFVIGLFYGVTKPDNLEFLSDFVNECRALLTHGIPYNDFLLNFTISALVCDAPARAFLKNIKGHTSYSACERCSQTGAWNGKMTFPEINAKKRTDARS